MNTYKTSLIAICTTLLSWTSGHAAFDPTIVPADSQWLVYLNFNTLRESELGRQMVEMIPVAEMTQGDDAIRPNIPKIFETVGSITAFGRDFPRNPQSANGALILQGTPDLRTIVEGLMAQLTVMHPEGVAEVADLPFEAYSIQGGNAAVGAQVMVALPPEPIVVVSKSREQLLNALEVFRENAPSMRTERSALAALIPQTGAYYMIAASNVPSSTMFPANAPQSRILQMAKSAAIAVGEEADRVVARLQLDASTDDLAVKLEKIVDGVIAMASLAETNDQRLNEFIQSFDSTREGRTIRIELSYPTARIMEMIQTVTTPPPPTPSAAAQTLSPPGSELDRWVADQNPGDLGAGPTGFLTHTIENVRLQPGTLIVLSSIRGDGENGRFDYVDVVPAGGEQPVRLEAEYMRLNNYRVESVSHASGGEVIIIEGSPSDARTQWSGGAGDYTLQVRYVDENDGASTFAVSLIEPEIPAAGRN